MALLDFQRALGVMVMNGSTHEFAVSKKLDLTEKEIRSLAALTDTPGMKLTSDIQRSWSRGRAFMAAPLTLSLMQTPVCAHVIDEWIRSRNSTSSFYSTVALDFLEYLVERLPDPSHILSVCRFEQAVLKAGLGALRFESQNLASPVNQDVFLQKGHCASLVIFHSDPTIVLNAVLSRKALPEIQEYERYLLFAPRIPGLFRCADDCDAAIWRLIEKPTAFSWLRHKWPSKSFEELLQHGIAEIAEVTCRA